ncbi:MAG TPA: hypothetical protein VN414_07020 [Methanosarcina sp.]|nr:hypothetical protein [Methanosarcina sp.]
MTHSIVLQILTDEIEHGDDLQAVTEDIGLLQRKYDLVQYVIKRGITNG